MMEAGGDPLFVFQVEKTRLIWYNHGRMGGIGRECPNKGFFCLMSVIPDS